MVSKLKMLFNSKTLYLIPNFSFDHPLTNNFVQQCDLKDWSYGNIQLVKNMGFFFFFFSEIESLKLSVFSIKYPRAAYNTVLEYLPWNHPSGERFITRCF